MAMSAGDPTHARHLKTHLIKNCMWRHIEGNMFLEYSFTCGTETGAGGEGARLMILLQFGLNEGNIVMDQIFYFSVIPGTGNSLRASLADEQAVAGTSHISTKSN